MHASGSEELADVAAERAVLSGIYRYKHDAYADVSDIITARTFTVDSNQVWYKCLEHLLQQDINVVPDVPSLMSAAQALGFGELLSTDDERKHLRAITQMPVEQGNLRRLAAKIRKLEIARVGLQVADGIKSDLFKVTGDESIEAILSLLETPITDFGIGLSTTGQDGPRPIGEGIELWLAHLAQNQVSQMGVPSGFKEWDATIGGGLRPGTVNVLGARPKTGKAQPLTATVYTPNGPKKMGDIKPGDEVCTAFGTAIVDSIWPQGLKQVYRVEFADGDVVECCGDHLWEVTQTRTRKTYVLDTNTIANDLTCGDGRLKWEVRLPEPAVMVERQLPIDPYIMGVLLGDGGMSGHSVLITNSDRSNFYVDRLRELGLMGKTSRGKFIPEDYKYASIIQRSELLNGLIDADGYVDEKGNIEYSTISMELSFGVKELVQSLGGLCRIVQRTTTFHDKKRISYRCHIRFTDASRISRCKPRTKRPLARQIKSVTLTDVEPCQCISLQGPVQLYLTDHYVVTHNTTLGITMARHVTGKLGLPALYLDTEMQEDDHRVRNLAALSGVPMTSIETGQFAQNEETVSKVEEAAERMKGMPYDMLSIAGQPFEETLAIMRRWVIRKVGLNANGKANPCVIVFDYLKLMDAAGISRNVQEFQLLGFIMTGLHNFAVKYGIPIVLFVQLNRDGIDTENSTAASGSDRIIWLCSNFTIYKKLSEEEQAEMSRLKAKFNRKFIVTDCRHGPGLDNDFIYARAEMHIARITEGPTRSLLERQEGGFGDTTDDQITF